MKVKPEVILQYAGNEYETEELLKKAETEYAKENKAAIKQIKLYVKPEEGKAYYVVNDDVNGSIAI